MTKAAAVALLLSAALCSPAAAAVGDGEAAYQFALAKMLAQEGRYREALDAFDAAVEGAPGEVYVRLEYAEYLSRIGRLERAAEQVGEARRLDPESLDALRLEGRVQLTLAEEDEEALALAKAAFEELRRRDPADPQSMASLGRIYLSEGRPELAAEVFREAALHQPGNRMLLSFLVESLLRSDRSGESERVLEDLLAVDPAYLQGRILLARLQSERGEHATAAGTLAAAPAEQLSDPELRRALGAELFGAGDLGRALEVVEELLSEQPDNTAAALLRARILAAQGHHASAEEQLEVLLADRPRSVELALALLPVLERQEKAAEAGELLRGLEARLREGGDVEQGRAVRSERAFLSAREEDWTGVLAVADEALAEEGNGLPDELLALRAEALLHLGRSREALEAAPDGADSPILSAKRAELLLGLGREEDGQRELARLEEARTVEGLLAAAGVYQRLERYPEAVAVLERARELDAESLQVLFWLGSAHERSGQRRRAEEAFRELLRLDPEFAPALNYLGYMWAERGENLEEALGMVRRAVTLEPDNGAFVDSLGWTHYQLGDFERAASYLERASRLVPDDPTVLEHLGDVYQALGLRERARASYERSLGLDGDNLQAVRRKLRELDRQP